MLKGTRLEPPLPPHPRTSWALEASESLSSVLPVPTALSFLAPWQPPLLGALCTGLLVASSAWPRSSWQCALLLEVVWRHAGCPWEAFENFPKTTERSAARGALLCAACRRDAHTTRAASAGQRRQGTSAKWLPAPPIFQPQS